MNNAGANVGDVRTDEFERVLGLGLGRPILMLREHDAGPHRAAILRACMHTTAYDPQLEGSRAPYLFEVLQATGDAGGYLADILAALLATTDFWDAYQLFDLARHFAQAGYGRARAAMYEKFSLHDGEEPFIGAEALIRLDGLPGVLAVAESVGRGILSDATDWADPGLLEVANETCGEAAVRDALAQARAGSPGIAAFLGSLTAVRSQRDEAARQRQNLTSAPYDKVKREIADRPSRQLGVVILQRWGRAASDDEIHQAAIDLLAERDEDRLVSYLRIFGKRRFPLNPGPLFLLARHKNRRLMAASFAALSQLSDPQVRAFALDLLEGEHSDGWAKGRALDLLTVNYQPEDASRLADWLSGTRDRDDLHSLGLGMRTLAEDHPSMENVPALLYLYEHGPCSMCRAHTVELLHGLDALPAWMLEESRCDAKFDLRARAESWRAVPRERRSAREPES